MRIDLSAHIRKNALAWLTVLQRNIGGKMTNNIMQRRLETAEFDKILKSKSVFLKEGKEKLRDFVHDAIIRYTEQWSKDFLVKAAFQLSGDVQMSKIWVGLMQDDAVKLKHKVNLTVKKGVSIVDSRRTKDFQFDVEKVLSAWDERATRYIETKHKKRGAVAWDAEKRAKAALNLAAQHADFLPELGSQMSAADAAKLSEGWSAETFRAVVEAHGFKITAKELKKAA